MTKYLRLARITAWPASLFSFAVGFGVGAGGWTSWEGALFGFLGLFSFFSFAYALNFYSDRDVDRHHDGWLKDVKLSQQPVLVGDITERRCAAFCILTSLLAILFAWLAGHLVALLMFGACLIGGIVYSHPSIRAKSRPVADVACISCLSAVLFAAGYAVACGSMPTWPMLLFFTVFSAIVYIPTVVSDYEYDVLAGLRTSAVVFGQHKLVKAMLVLWLCALAVAWLIMLEPYALGSKACVLLACVAAAVYTATAWKSLKAPRFSLTWVSRHPRLAWILSGSVPLLFVSWGWFKTVFSSHMPWDPFGLTDTLFDSVFPSPF